jgi:hypothetical protein
MAIVARTRLEPRLKRRGYKCEGFATREVEFRDFEKPPAGWRSDFVRRQLLVDA